MNVHSLSNSFAIPRKGRCSVFSKTLRPQIATSTPCYIESFCARRSATPLCCATHLDRSLSGFRLSRCFHGVRNNRNRLRNRLEPSERIWRRLPDKLEDRRSDAQNARGIHRRLQRAPPFLFRVSQDSV